MTAVAILHKDEILKRVAKGDKIADIGKTYGVSHAVISKKRDSGVHLVLVLPRSRSRGTLLTYLDTICKKALSILVRK